MQAILRINEERTAYQVQVGDDEFETTEWPESQLQLMQSPGGRNFAAVLDGCEGLKAFTVYELVPIATRVQEETLDDGDDEGDQDIDPAALDAIEDDEDE